jgi:hypothetical protein
MSHAEPGTPGGGDAHKAPEWAGIGRPRANYQLTELSGEAALASTWKTPPGDGATSRRAGSIIKKVLGSFLVGALSVGAAWAGAGILPVSDELAGSEADTIDVAGQARGSQNLPVVSGEESAGGAVASNLDLGSGRLMAGAAKVSLEPRPDEYGGTWETNYNKCANLAPNQEGVQEGLMHVADFRVRWAENSNCIFMGGYGIGPMFPIVEWDDEYGLWARSVAMSDGQDAVVLTLIDAVYWEAQYENMCDGCGFAELSRQLAEETGLSPDSFIFASTHSHTAPDFIGGWGGVPEWYMTQATDALKKASLDALTSMKPAVLETGEVIARQFNGERRDYYRSAEDDGMSWFRLVDAASKKKSPTAIATVGAYAAHPVTADHETGVGNADFPAVFAKRVEEAFGGVGMFLQTGLGNMSPRGDKVQMGNGLAALVPAIGQGSQVTDTNIAVGRTAWDQPVTNVPLGSLGVTGFFDRSFAQSPSHVSEGKGPENKKCRSASPISVNTSVSAVKIGSLWITGGPGELFSNLTNTIEERNPGGVTLALGLVNDGLGYIVQSFETDHLGRQGTGFVGEDPSGNFGIAEYEDAYSIDHCFGDAVLENTLRLLGGLNP